MALVGLIDTRENATQCVDCYHLSRHSRNVVFISATGMELLADTALGKLGTRFRGHEFHYATVVEEGEENPLFHARLNMRQTVSWDGIANVSGHSSI